MSALGRVDNISNDFPVTVPILNHGYNTQGECLGYDFLLGLTAMDESKGENGPAWPLRHLWWPCWGPGASNAP